MQTKLSRFPLAALPIAVNTSRVGKPDTLLENLPIEIVFLYYNVVLKLKTLFQHAKVFNGWRFWDRRAWSTP